MEIGNFFVGVFFFFEQKNKSFFEKSIYFLERVRVEEREVEKHKCVVASHMPTLGTWPTTQACAMTGNRTSYPLVHRPALNPLSHTSQGQSFF